MSRLATLGLNPVARGLIALQALILLITVWLCLRLGFSLVWPTVVPSIIGLGMVIVLWLSFVARPGSSKERATAETIFVLALLLLLSNIGAAAQYPAIAFGRPLVEALLARADAAMGVNVSTLQAWTHAHGAIARVFYYAYLSLVPQFVLAIVLLGLVYRDRDCLWEFTFHFHVCLAVTLTVLALYPADVPAHYYGYTAVFDQTRFTQQFYGLRDATLRTIDFTQFEGLICIPSFHVAGGLMVTWAFRGRRVFWPLVVLNAVLILATLMSGVHWAIDLVATVPLFGCSLALYRWWGAPLMRVR